MNYNEAALNWCNDFEENLKLHWKDEAKYTSALNTMYICKEALNKQIPKKPIIEKGLFKKRLCPACNDKLTYKAHHCGCGQTIDWSVAQDGTK